MDVTQPPSVSAAVLSRALASHDNAFGFLRLVLALLVIVDHAFPLGGFGEDPMWGWTRGQESFGGIAVGGFFGISGYLIAKSSLGNDWLQFLWRRGLRIFPGYWGVLLFSAVVVGPAVWKAQHLGLRTYFTADPIGPFAYVTNNLFLHIGRYCIYDIFATTTPYGLKTKESIFNGSLWTLIYEWRCYLVVLALSVANVFARARVLIVPLALGLLILVNVQLVSPDLPGHLTPIFADVFMLRFGCVFALGALAALYADQIPLDDRLGWLSLILFVGSLAGGGYGLVGYPALVYALLWLAVRLPAALRAIGASNDYSYGIYLYGFLVQQILAYAGLYRLGLIPYIAASMLVASGCAWISWHAIEKPAMRLKSFGPGRGVASLLRSARLRLAPPLAKDLPHV